MNMGISVITDTPDKLGIYIQITKRKVLYLAKSELK
jgi:hypothetical protein